MNAPLRDLEGELSMMDYGGGVKLPVLLFECPAEGCNRGHSQVIPYSDQPFHEVDYPVTAENRAGVGRKIKIWQRMGGTTIDDITLVPSFLVPSCNQLHGFVTLGHWVSA